MGDSLHLCFSPFRIGNAGTSIYTQKHCAGGRRLSLNWRYDGGVERQDAFWRAAIQKPIQVLTFDGR